MRMAVVQNGVVTNIVEASAGWSGPPNSTVVPSDTAGIGWVYVNSTLAPPPSAPISVAQLVAAANLAQASVLAKGRTFNVAASSGQPAVEILSDGEGDTLGTLSSFAVYGQANPTGQRTWVDNNGVATVLSGTQCVALNTAVSDWANNVYAALVTLLQDIQNRPPSVTTLDQIASFAWPTS